MKRREITNHNDKYVVFYEFSEESSEFKQSTEELSDGQSQPQEDQV